MLDRLLESLAALGRFGVFRRGVVSCLTMRLAG